MRIPDFVTNPTEYIQNCPTNYGNSNEYWPNSFASSFPRKQSVSIELYANSNTKFTILHVEDVTDDEVRIIISTYWRKVSMYRLSDGSCNLSWNTAKWCKFGREFWNALLIEGNISRFKLDLHSELRNNWGRKVGNDFVIVLDNGHNKIGLQLYKKFDLNRAIITIGQ